MLNRIKFLINMHLYYNIKSIKILKKHSI